MWVYSTGVNFFATDKDRKAVLKVLSGLFTNIAAAWFAAVFIVPNFAGITSFDLLILTLDLVAGTLCLWLSYKLERKAL